MDSGIQQTAQQAALRYHELPKPGKLEIRATKPMANQRDLSLAYSPGVAEACLEIKADPTQAARYTTRGNLVAVVSNGTAVLGLGNIGAQAARNQGTSKPARLALPATVCISAYNHPTPCGEALD